MNLHRSIPGRHRQRGFTLIEIAAVLILLGVLAAGALSVLPRNDAALATEVDRLSSHLRYTQIRAQADTHQWRLAFIDTQTYQLGPVVIPGAGFTPTVVPGTGALQRTLTDGVTVPAQTVIRFDSWGRPLTDAGIPLAANQTITLSQGGGNVAIIINADTGLIR